MDRGGRPLERGKRAGATQAFFQVPLQRADGEPAQLLHGRA